MCELQTEFNNLDVILLCKTWIKEDYQYSNELKNYESYKISRMKYRNKRAKRGSGGLLCYIKRIYGIVLGYIGGGIPKNRYLHSQYKQTTSCIEIPC